MTELQLGLIGLGAAAVVGVIAYNKWQEHRQRQLAARLLDEAHRDVLLDGAPQPAESRPEAEPESLRARPGERIEPVLEFAAPPMAFEAPDDKAAPAVEDVSFAEDREPSPEALYPPEPAQWLSPLIDDVVALHAERPVREAAILDGQSRLTRLNKPVLWLGYDEEAGEWEALAADGENAYRHLRIGLQLVDRHGPVSEAELSVFHAAMEDLAGRLPASLEAPMRASALSAARRLDEFCAGVDVQIGINIVAQAEPFAGTKLRALAESAGMSLDAARRFVRFDDEGNVLYVLVNHDPSGFSAESMRSLSTSGITFLLDVPRVPHGERVFNQIVELARRFAEALRGVVVDDNRRPLSAASMEPIREQIVHYQTALAAQGLPAGTFFTRRLFS